MRPSTWACCTRSSSSGPSCACSSLAAAPSSAAETCSTLPVPSTGTRVATPCTHCLHDAPALGATVSGQDRGHSDDQQHQPAGAVVIDRMVLLVGVPLASPGLPARRPRRAVPDGARHHAACTTAPTSSACGRSSSTAPSPRASAVRSPSTTRRHRRRRQDVHRRGSAARRSPASGSGSRSSATVSTARPSRTPWRTSSRPRKPDAFAYLGDVYDRGTDRSSTPGTGSTQTGFGQFARHHQPDGRQPRVHGVAPPPSGLLRVLAPDPALLQLRRRRAGTSSSIDSNTEFGQLGDQLARSTRGSKRDLEANTDTLHAAVRAPLAGHQRRRRQPGRPGAGVGPHGRQRRRPHARRPRAHLRAVAADGRRPGAGHRGPRRSSSSAPVVAASSTTSTRTPRTAADVTTPGALLLDLGDTDAQLHVHLRRRARTPTPGTLPCRTAPTSSPHGHVDRSPATTAGPAAT